MAAFLGTAAACILLAVSSLVRWREPDADLTVDLP
jgi:uncharacterized membrane protein